MWKNIFLFFFALFLFSCAKLVTSSGALPPGEPPNDNNNPTASSGPAGELSDAGDGSGGVFESGQGDALPTHLPSASPGTSQHTTAQTYVPGG